MAGEPAGFRATLCRCGASKHKPYCDSSHKEVGFGASGEPATQGADALAVRNGPLHVDPEHNGPLAISGNRRLRRALIQIADNLVRCNHHFRGLSARWLESRILPAPEGLAIFFRDVTDRREAAEALEASERRFRSVVESAATPSIER